VEEFQDEILPQTKRQKKGERFGSNSSFIQTYSDYSLQSLNTPVQNHIYYPNPDSFQQISNLSPSAPPAAQTRTYSNQNLIQTSVETRTYSNQNSVEIRTYPNQNPIQTSVETRTYSNQNSVETRTYPNQNPIQTSVETRTYSNPISPNFPLSPQQTTEDSDTIEGDLEPFEEEWAMERNDFNPFPIQTPDQIQTYPNQFSIQTQPSLISFNFLLSPQQTTEDLCLDTLDGDLGPFDEDEWNN